MKKGTKRLLLCCLLLLLTGLWVWRFVAVNRFYRELEENDGCDTEYYELGETVVFGDNAIVKESVEGYTFRVDRVEITDYAPYDTEGIGPEDQMILVYATVGREAESDSPGVPLNELYLYGLENDFYMDYDALNTLNPGLNGANGISLPVGSSYDVILPYHAVKDYFSPETWAHLDEYELWLSTTGYFPTRKDIKVQ